MLSARPAGCPLPGAARKQQQQVTSGAGARAAAVGDVARRSAARLRSSSSAATGRPKTTSLRATLKAVIFDCDGVLLESEELHRTAYNAAFAKFNVACPGDGATSGSDCPSGATVDWSAKFYDVLQNTIGGGKPKMRWYFAREGWPSSTGILPAEGAAGQDFGGAACGPAAASSAAAASAATTAPRVPTNEAEQALLVDALQDFKSAEFRRLIGSGEVPPRPGVLRLMDAARAAGLRVAVCSAATRESCVFTVRNLLGEGRFGDLDVFMAGDDVPRKKPDPMIYALAAQRLSLDPSECVVIEDSMVGLGAALGASMRCVITTTPSTADQQFAGAALVVPSLEEGAAGAGGGGGPVTVDTLRALVAAPVVAAV